jgi:hypothetical protein
MNQGTKATFVIGILQRLAKDHSGFFLHGAVVRGSPHAQSSLYRVIEVSNCNCGHVAPPNEFIAVNASIMHCGEAFVNRQVSYWQVSDASASIKPIDDTTA